MEASLAGQGGGAKEQVRGLPVAGVHPVQDLWEQLLHLDQSGFPISQVEGVAEIHLEAPQRGVSCQNLPRCVTPTPVW